MPEGAERPRGGVWARGFGVALAPAAPEAAIEACPGIARALRDAAGRGFGGPLPLPPAGALCCLVRAGGEAAGLLTVERSAPGEAILGVAIAPERRGRSLGARAVFAAERRLRREGVRSFGARAARANGRGLYFWLRAGYLPLRGPATADGATWFRRSAAAGDAPDPATPRRRS